MRVKAVGKSIKFSIQKINVVANLIRRISIEEAANQLRFCRRQALSKELLKVLNSGDYNGVPAQIMRWNKAGGKVLEGLTRRREAEARLFSGT